MPVIINEFEALAEAPPSSMASDSTAEDRDARPSTLEPDDLMPVLHALRDRALRLWAH
jgi:hypothetical protein